MSAAAKMPAGESASTHHGPIRGGLALSPCKEQSTRQPSRRPALPEQLILPLRQHIGSPATAVIKRGQRVLKWQLLATPPDYSSVPLHAPTSGVVRAIESRPVPHPSGLAATSIVIDVDGDDRSIDPMPALTDVDTEPMLLRQRLRNAGLVGLGGAAFPAAVKLDAGTGQNIDLLIINGAECEPYISCDEMLMRELPAQVIEGAGIMRRIVSAGRCIIAIEERNALALAAMNKALQDAPGQDMEIRVLPTHYPIGGEKQLIQVLTGREVPDHCIPAQIGIICQNVATAAAAAQAVSGGQPLISRYVTVTGQGVAEPANLDALIGTPIPHLVQTCGGYTSHADRLIMGGAMMGFAVADDDIPVTKASNCILIASIAELAPVVPAMPCIRCGDCIEACPAGLLPQQLYWHSRAKDLDAARDYHLFDCIECGCCAAVCPSRIPLVQYYRFAKTAIRARERDLDKAEMARQRYQSRQHRLQRDTLASEDRARRRRQALQHGGGEEHKRAVIESALARARQRRQRGTGSRPPAEQAEEP